MNKSFVITAIPSMNLLKIVLGGIFMKSEIEHALHLIKLERMKLKEGFKVLLDIDNLQTKTIDIVTVEHKIQQLIRTNDSFERYSILKRSGDFYH